MSAYLASHLARHDNLVGIVVYTAVLFIMVHVAGLYQRELRDSYRVTVRHLSVGFIVATFCFIFAYVFYRGMMMSLDAVLIAMVLSFSGLLTTRYIYVKLVEQAKFASKILVVGTGRLAKPIADLKRRSDWQGLQLVGFLALAHEPHEVSEDRILSNDCSLLELARNYQVDQIVLASDHVKQQFTLDELLACKMAGFDVIDVLKFFEQRLARIELDALQPEQIALLEGFAETYWQRLFRRMRDLIVSCVGLIVCAPLMLVIAMMIRFSARKDERGPVFYKQHRVGQNGRLFWLYKFRSMVVQKEEGHAQWTQVNDQRITRIGSWLRRLHLDELPQLFNVLIGDMRFIGPRPEQPEFVEMLRKKVPYYDLRHRLKPGITGWAQISYPYGASLHDAKEKLQYDLYYIKHHSLFLDLTIFLQTIPMILWQRTR